MTERYFMKSLNTHILSEWSEELSQHLGRSAEQIQQKGLSASDIPLNESLHIQLMDGSFVQFEYAFHLVSPAKRAIAVFTEHCGYHVFPSAGATVSRIQRDVLYVDER